MSTLPPYTPPCTITPAMLRLVAEIGEAIGRLSVLAEEDAVSLRLRRKNRIRTVQGSLAIEGNTLSESQITAILEGRRVLAPPREILEVRNALAGYEQLASWQQESEADLLNAHKMLMEGLLEDAGQYRSGGVGVMAGTEVIHLAPPASRVPLLMTDLLQWLGTTDLHPLVTGSIFHYEFEFIHPFADGNGRMGRLWQTLILYRWNPVFAEIPVESLIHEHQKEYYAALQESTRQTDCSPFVEFMLAMIYAAVTKISTTQETTRETTQEKIISLLERQPGITRKELAVQVGISADGIKYHLEKLKAAGKIRHVGPTKKGHWEIIKNA